MLVQNSSSSIQNVKIRDQFKNHLFYSHNNYQICQNCPRGVLVGCVGTGKTTFFNKITNQDQLTSDGIFSATVNSFSCSSAYGNNFKILDTPGIQAETDKIKHALGLRSALIEGPINRIFLLVKFDRIGVMLKNIQELLLTFSEWQDIITIVITHWDRGDTHENRKIFEDSKKKILENLFELKNSFIFVGQKSVPKQLCKAVYRSLCQSNPVQIKIDMNKFKCKFDLFQNISKYIIECKEQFKNVEQSILQSIYQYNENDKDEFLHACIVNISQIAEEIIVDFEKQHGNNMEEIQCYTHYLELKREFFPIVEKIRKVASQNMSYDLLNPKDPRNKFKKCQHCGLIWLKVEGCDGNTTCGNRTYGKDVYLKDSYFQTFQYDWRNLKWVKKQKQSVPYNQSNYNKTNNGIGCGKAINWGQAPIISDETIQQLKDAGINDIMIDNMEFKFASYNQTLLNESEKIKVQAL